MSELWPLVPAVVTIAARRAAPFQQQSAETGLVIQEQTGTFTVPQLQRIGFMPAFPVHELQLQDKIVRTAFYWQNKRNIPAREWLPDRLKGKPRPGGVEKSRKTAQPGAAGLVLSKPQEFLG